MEENKMKSLKLYKHNLGELIDAFSDQCKELMETTNLKEYFRGQIQGLKTAKDIIGYANDEYKLWDKIKRKK